MPRSYIPASDLAARVWLVNFAAIIAVNPIAFGITAAQSTTITNASNSYVAAYALATDPGTRSPVTVAAKDATRNASIATVRPYAVQIASSPAVTDANKVLVGVTVRDVGRTPIPAPASAPLLAFMAGTPLQAKIKISDENSPNLRAKAAGAAGLEFFCFVGTVAPVSPEATPYYGHVSRSPFVMNFAAGSGGKTAFCYARWVTARGLKGPWSQMLSFTVVG